MPEGHDSHLDLSDAIFLLAHLYLGAGPPCLLADPPELLARIAELEADVATLEADLESKIGELAQAAERMAAREAGLQAAFALREAELQAALTEREAEVEARTEQAMSCEQELEEWKESHWEQCRDRWDRFLENGDGTVKDICTGLMWQQVPQDTNRDGQLDLRDRLTWDSAVFYADALELAGHTDWRLPSFGEFSSLYLPDWAPGFHPLFGLWQVAAYWTDSIAPNTDGHRLAGYFTAQDFRSRPVLTFTSVGPTEIPGAFVLAVRGPRRTVQTP